MRDNCLELPWVQEGNRVITRVIQSSTSLAHDKYKVLASTDAARDEEGTTLRPSDKAELATLFAAAPDLLEIVRELSQWYSEGTDERSGPFAYGLFGDEEDTTWAERVRNAIAKAEGGLSNGR